MVVAAGAKSAPYTTRIPSGVSSATGPATAAAIASVARTARRTVRARARGSTMERNRLNTTMPVAWQMVEQAVAKATATP